MKPREWQQKQCVLEDVTQPHLLQGCASCDALIALHFCLSEGGVESLYLQAT